MELIQDLNPSQQEAVAYNDGPLLVIAGAGSGKTRVLTYKIAYLLSQNIPANHILALTFTNKAAREMKERIMRLVPPELSRYLWMGTFHSICARILRQEAGLLGYTRDFTIYDTADTKSLLKQLCKEMRLDEKIYKPAAVLPRISMAKNALVTPEAYAANSNYTKQDRYDRMYNMAELYSRYQTRLKSANAMDFDDLLMLTCYLLRTYPEVLRKYQEVFEYILVDEYQDTNYAQYLIVRLLGEPQNHVCVVGDDAQSIYSFRGADIRNILTFQQGYPNARLFKLERNYRSTQTIVKAANSLIHHNTHQIHKEVYSEKAEGERLTLTPYSSDRDEATGIAHDIRRARNYDSVAVLYRTNAQSRALENELRRLNIPYRIYGGTSFYQRKEVKDAIAYFRLVVNPLDNEALQRVINFPARGLGDTTLRKINEQAIANEQSMYQVICAPEANGLEVNKGILKRLADFVGLMKVFEEAIETMDAYNFAELVLTRSGVMTAAALDRSPEGIDRKENLEELLSGIHDFVDQRMQEGISFTPIQDFLAEVSLLTDQDENLQDHTSRVTLMTVHAAKGLEFPVVYIAGMEENLFPSQFCQSESELEEERRLLYVAITRAMEQCHLSYARSRFKNGSLNFSSPSRFLNDIDRQYLQVLSGNSTIQMSMTGGFRPAPSFATSTTTSLPTMPRLPKLSPLSTTAERSTAPSAAAADYPEGTRVSHRVFGAGTVQRVYRENDNDKIDILFDQTGRKTLLLTYAKLQKI